VAHGEFGEHVISRNVVGCAVVPEFDRQVVAAEGADETLELTFGGARTLLHQRTGQRTLATPAQHEPLVGAVGDLVERKTRCALLAARQVCFAEHRGERAVAIWGT
jgi:hypothetical protein